MPFTVLGLVLVVRVAREYLGVGFGGLNYVGNILLAVGWVIGYYLADVDHLFYALVCNPQELSCQRVRYEIEKRDWKNAWRMLKETAHERTRLPVHNVLTGLIVAVMGIWTVTSSGSLLASGVVVGLSLRLLIEFWQTADYASWYWLFARQFDTSQHRLVRGFWTGLVVVQGLILLR